MKTRNVKIMRIIARLNVGGPALHCLLLSKNLTRRGYETVLVTGTPEPGEASFEELFGIKAEGFRLVRLSRLRRMVSFFGDLKTFFQILWLMFRERPDIVHTHTAKAGVLGRIAALIARVPVRLHTFHGHVLSGYFSPLLSKAVCAVERFLARGSTAIVTLSPELKRELSEKFSVAPSEKIHVVPLGRDLSDFLHNEPLKGRLRQELQLGPEALLVGIVGRLAPIKDHQTLFQAMASLTANPHWVLLVVGRGPIEEELLRQVKALGIEKRVRFLGWRNDLAALYADMDLMVLSSRNEGTPLSIIEAFASGCPVVSTEVGGVADLFRPLALRTTGSFRLCKEGALVKAADSQALAAAINAFLEDPELRKRAGAQARNASDQFTAEALTDRIEQLYLKLLANPV